MEVNKVIIYFINLYQFICAQYNGNVIMKWMLNKITMSTSFYLKNIGVIHMQSANMF